MTFSPQIVHLLSYCCWFSLIQDLLIPQYSRNSSVTLSEKEYLEVGTFWKLVQVVCRPRKKVFSSNNEAPSFIYRMGVS